MGQLASGYGTEGLYQWLAQQRAQTLENQDRQQQMLQQERENYLRMQQEDRNRQVFERQTAELDAAPARAQQQQIELERIIQMLPPEAQTLFRLSNLTKIPAGVDQHTLEGPEKHAAHVSAEQAAEDTRDIDVAGRRAAAVAKAQAEHRPPPQPEQYKDVPRRVDRVDDDPNSPTYGENIVEFVPESQLGGRTFRQSLPQGIRTRVADLDVADQSFATIEHLFNPAWVGPVAGRTGPLGQKIPGVPVDPLQAEFYAQLTAIRNATIKAITGAQMSEPEARRIMSQIPSAEDKPEVFAAKMRATKQNQGVLRAKLSVPGSQRSGAPTNGGSVGIKSITPIP